LGNPKLAILAACMALTLPRAGAATTFKQAGFSESAVFTGLINPTAVRFLPDGRVLVIEKNGRIRMFDSLSDTTPTTVADLRPQVHNFWDRGLLGLAIDPDFATNSFIYVAYTRDAAIGLIPPRWGPGDGTSDPCPTPPGPTTDGCVVSGRLSRLTAVGDDWTASEQMVLEDWCQQFPSHSVGSLAFGLDGYLYVSGGDGGSFNNQDWGQFGGTLGLPPVIPANPCGDPPFPIGTPQTKPTAEGGALRAQSPRRTAGEPRVLSGSILRVDPATGLAAPDNPFVLGGSTDLNEQRIIGYGFRNPFRIIVRPGTNDVWIADVGWGAWEELNRIPDLTEMRNFGWPCREGSFTQYTGLDICPTAAETEAPFFAYHHTVPAAPNDGCPTGGSAIGGLAFYLGGTNYPPAYANALFLSDYTRQCMWVMFPGAGGDPDPATIAPFASNAFGPVDLQIGPDGNVYYVDFDNGRVMRVSFGLHAVASANPTSGPVPLTVQFDSTGSTPAQPGDTLSFAWDLDGDGAFDDSTAAQPSFIYTVLGSYSARLRVSDGHGGFDISAPIVIEAGNEAPTATILTPTSALTWKVGDLIAFSGEATDPQEGALPASALSWDVIIHHCPSNCHEHTYQSFAGVASGSFAAPDHEYPAFLEIRLTAVDSGALSSTASVNVNPQTVTLSFATTPPGLQLSSGTLTQPAPFDQTVIANSQITIAAPSPQGAYPAVWEFAAWSDGGAQSHTITAAAPASYTASFALHADLSLVMSAAPEPVCAGLPVTYTLDVANAGPSRAVSVTVVDTLPAGVSLVSAGGDGWTCNGTAIVTCARPALDLGPAPAIAIVVSSPTSPGTLVNAATVGSTTSDIFGSNNSAQASTTVQSGILAPSITAPEGAAIGATGLSASVESHAGAAYAWTLEGGTITGGQGTSAITFDAGAPGTTMVLAVAESDAVCTSPAAQWPVQVDFLDVAPAHMFHAFVVAIARSGVTAGCGGGNYCPDASVTREQMAVFLLKSLYGASHQPPPATGTVFADVAASDPFAAWIEELAALGVTGGCGGGNYCPAAPVTRAQMAVFLLKTLLGSGYVPPPASGIFGDVPAADPFAAWIEELFARGVTGGCQAAPLLYCPANPNNRGQMAVFLTLTFSL
jgi:uncharacterized repeat protein (TIGR01451 family)